MTEASPPGGSHAGADDIDFLAQHAYSLGTDPVAYAEQQVAMIIDVFALVRAARELDPATFPGFPQDMSTDMLTRRILGGLLGSGWTPPGGIPDTVSACLDNPGHPR